MKLVSVKCLNQLCVPWKKTQTKLTKTRTPIHIQVFEKSVLPRIVFWGEQDLYKTTFVDPILVDPDKEL